MGVPPCKAGRFSQTSPPGCPFATALSSQLLAMPDVGRVDRHFGGAKVFVAAEVLQCQLGLATWVNPQGDPLILGGHEQKSALVYLDSKLTEIKGGYSFCNTSHMFFWGIGIQPTKINSNKTMPNYASTWLSNSRVRLSDWPFIETPFSTQKNMVNWCDVLRFWEQTSSIIFVYSHKKKDQKGLFELTPGGPFRVRQSPWNSNKGMLEKFAVDLGMHQNFSPMTPIDFGKLE